MPKKTLVFDFDGVIHVGYKGWKDGSIYGQIDNRLIEYIKSLMGKYYIVISSNRPANQIVEHLNNLDLGVDFEVFNKDMDSNMYWNKDNIIGVTNEKAVGVMYIDDRGFKYTCLEDLEHEIKYLENNGGF